MYKVKQINKVICISVILSVLKKKNCPTEKIKEVIKIKKDKKIMDLYPL